MKKTFLLHFEELLKIIQIIRIRISFTLGRITWTGLTWNPIFCKEYLSLIQKRPWLSSICTEIHSLQMRRWHEWSMVKAIVKRTMKHEREAIRIQILSPMIWNHSLKRFNLAISSSIAWTYFLPELSLKEMELIEKKDEDYIRSFKLLNDADVNETEMKLSSSSSKYVSAFCRRKTIVIDSKSFPKANQESY